jgi:hypothetical protein
MFKNKVVKKLLLIKSGGDEVPKKLRNKVLEKVIECCRVLDLREMTREGTL